VQCREKIRHGLHELVGLFFVGQAAALRDDDQLGIGEFAGDGQERSGQAINSIHATLARFPILLKSR